MTAEMIIENSLEKAHGGKALWERSKTLVYEKTTTFYDSLGAIESVKKQVFHNTLQPEFTSKVKWIEDGVEKRIIYNGKETLLFFDEVQQTDEKAIEKAYKEVMGAQYVLWQPYKLFTDEASLEYQGKVQLEDRTVAYKIEVIYPNSDVQWWYYFDAKTFLLKENLIKHNSSTYSQIVNIKQEDKTGLQLHQDRKSFKVDVAKNQKYLRAEYHYNILTLK